VFAIFGILKVRPAGFVSRTGLGLGRGITKEDGDEIGVVGGVLGNCITDISANLNFEGLGGRLGIGDSDMGTTPLCLVVGMIVDSDRDSSPLFKVFMCLDALSG
jgi:hypothetical protein